MLAGLFSSSSYVHNPYAFPMFITALLVVLFGIYTLTQERSAVSKSLLVATMCAALWLAGTGSRRRAFSSARRASPASRVSPAVGSRCRMM